MAQEQILLSPIPIDELESRIQTIVRQEITKKEEDALLERLLSPEQTRHIFNPPISKVTLHHWAKQGKVKPHRIGGRVFYKYSELMESLVHLKRYGR
jgi:hypothetical protein